MYDLVYLAFVTDQTRIRDLHDRERILPAPASCGTTPTTRWATRARPTTSPTSGPTSISGQWDRWRNENHAYFLKRLADTHEGDGTMLDNTLVLYGSAHPHASHSGYNYPLQLAGGKNMGFQHGHLHEFVDDKKVPLANLFVTMLQAMDIPDETSSPTAPAPSTNS